MGLPTERPRTRVEEEKTRNKKCSVIYVVVSLSLLSEHGHLLLWYLLIEFDMEQDLYLSDKQPVRERERGRDQEIDKAMLSKWEKSDYCLQNARV